MIASLLRTYDFNLPLLDVIEDPETDERQRQLASLSLRQGLDGGYYDSQELADLVLGVASDHDLGLDMLESDAARDLMELIDRPGCHYQRSLHDALADLTFVEALAYLRWLSDLMGVRADMYRVIRAAGAPMPVLPNG
ncbi:hypothetical protein GG804_01850 [Sphingomonas histidinilytica]|uniref:hypothetical protein n=1 Tax=Sphingomonadales TaxID=204457 RepID=UPI000770417B|nr:MULTISPECIES: hypothetical protein [Sphingomonadaceae]AMK23272.1 hypothetical protein K426_11685 [Sphingobium sp. TKS]MBO9375501.1 hypothetical protein [Rhizorhabdus histidinilytica]MCF8709143.1 hypothetical protein [Rhizorhapis sp. SPR117]